MAGGLTIALATVGIQQLGTVAAQAHTGTISGIATCGSDGTYSVAWSGATQNVPTSGTGHTATLTIETPTSNPNTFPYIPASSTVSPLGQTVVGNTTYSFSQTNIPGNATDAEVTPFLLWGDGVTADPLGKVALGGNCHPTHQATAPSGANGKCDTTTHTQISPTITIPNDAGVTYKLDGTTKAANTYNVTAGTHTVVASSSTLTLTGQTSFSFNLTAAPADCNDVATPVAPMVVQAKCVAGSSTPTPPTLTLPTTTGITYTASPAGPYNGGDSVTVTATAKSGYEFTSSPPAGWTFVDSTHETYQVTFQTVNCVTTVSPVSPTLTQSTCAAPGRPTQGVLHIPSVTGVVYKIGANVVTGDINESPGQVLVVATPAGGYVFTGPQSVTYTLTFTDPGDCLVQVTPTAPTPTDAVCTTPGQHSDATLVIPNTAHVVYKINGTGSDVSGQTLIEPVGSSLNVVATPAAGYKFAGSQTVTYPVSFTDPGDCLVQVTPTAPTPTNAECTTPGQHSDATLVIPTTAHVVYKINGTGSDVSGQTLIEPVGSSLNVVATPAAGYKFTGPQTVTYPVSFTDPGDCLVTATPVTPTLTQSQCDGPGSSTPASIDIPSVTGVIYQIAGETVSGSIPVTAPGTVIVTAIPAPGYAFPVDAVTTWTEQFTDAGGCLVGVTVASPSFTNDACSAGHPTNGASYTIPATEHVTYTINGTAVPAGTYAATDGTTVTIIAVADEGYSLTGSTTFTHTFPVTDCVISVIPASASFAESVCTASGSVSSATYTVPNSTRVVYSIGGAVVRAGTHNAVAGSTVTIVATAVDGFTLSGVTQWTHTFGKTATCLDTGGTTTHRPATGGGSSGGPTANTGAPVAQILLTGIALILMGAACYLMAGTRRPRHGARRVMTIARRRRGLPTT